MPLLATKYNCTGCTACANSCSVGCITMVKDIYGFAFPAPDASACVECGSCSLVCPVLAEKSCADNQPSAYAAISLDDAERMESSSGGVFSLIAKEIIACGGAVYGAAYDEEFNVVHSCAENEWELAKLRGAKYAESNLGDSFAQIKTRLNNGQKVLFCGTPCQVAGLKAVCHSDNLFCADFVCHGIPSPMAWKAFLKYTAEKQGEKPVSVNLRSKTTGWSRYRYSNLFRFQSGRENSIRSGESLFMKLFVEDYICRSSCQDCHFKGYNRNSDFTLGDFWGIWDIHPHMDDDKGTSVVLVHSEKGRQLWQKISGKMQIKEVTLEQTSRQNPSMVTSSKAAAERIEVLDSISDGDIARWEKLLAPQKPSTSVRIKNRLKHLLGR